MSKKYTKKEFNEFIEQLFEEVYHANNRLKLHMYLHNKLVDAPKVIHETYPAYLNLTIDAIHSEFMISIAKIFDKSGYGTFFKMLNLIEAHPELFSLANNILTEQVQLDRQELNESSTISNIRTWRNQLFAHHDKKYFLNKNRYKLGEDAPILYQEHTELLIIAANKINYYSKYLNKNKYVLDNAQITEEVDTLISVLSK